MLARIWVLVFLLTGACLQAQSPPSAATDDQILEWFRAGQQAQARGDLAQAAAAYEKVVRARPEIAEAHSNLGVAYYMQARYADALASFDKALERKAGLFVAVVLSGASYAKMRRFQKAIPLLEKALQERPEDFQALLYLGISHAALGREIEGSRYLETLERTINLAPENRNAHYQLARAYQQLGRRQEAAREFQLFRELGSKPSVTRPEALDDDETPAEARQPDPDEQ